jgi:glutathione-independent formaldehyde dehydrogenase
VIEKGRDVEYLEIGDLVSVPFNIACGRCRTCREGDTRVCLNVNSNCAGGAYGYVDMGGWIGGQADYVMVPCADFNLLKFPDKAQAMEKIRDLTCLFDILPTSPAQGRRPCDRGVCAHPWRGSRGDPRHEPRAACPGHATRRLG